MVLLNFNKTWYRTRHEKCAGCFLLTIFNVRSYKNLLYFAWSVLKYIKSSFSIIACTVVGTFIMWDTGVSSGDKGVQWSYIFNFYHIFLKVLLLIVPINKLKQDLQVYMQFVWRWYISYTCAVFCIIIRLIIYNFRL